MKQQRSWLVKIFFAVALSFCSAPALQAGIVEDKQAELQDLIAQINDGNAYSFSQALAQLNDMKNGFAPIWGALNKSSSKDAVKDLYVDLAKLLTKQRARGSEEDREALKKILRMGLYGFHFKDTDHQDALTKLVESASQEVSGGQDFATRYAVLAGKIDGMENPDEAVLQELYDLIKARFDDENSQIKISPEIGLFSDSNYTEGTFKSIKLSYENSWDGLRGLVYKVSSHKAFQGYENTITLKGERPMKGVESYSRNMLSKLISPVSFDELAMSLKRLSEREPFENYHVTRFMDRVRYTAALLDAQEIKRTSEAVSIARARTGFVMRSLLSTKNSGNYLNTYKKNLEEIIERNFGTEALNEAMPEVGTVVALRWKNPNDGEERKYLRAVRDSEDVTRWYVAADGKDYVDHAALFRVVITGNKLGLKSLYEDDAYGNIGYLAVQINDGSSDGALTFDTNDKFKDNERQQFYMEGSRENASFKSATFRVGKEGESGYISVSNDGVVRTFNGLTRIPAGIFVNSQFTAGPWEQFELVTVSPFFVELGKARYKGDEARLAFIREAIKRAASDTTEGGVQKRMVAVRELAAFLEEQPQGISSLDADTLKQFNEVVEYAASMLKAYALKEREVRDALSRVRAEASAPPLANPRDDLPEDGEFVAVFVPNVPGISGGRYLQLEQEPGQNDSTRYIVRASSTDPITQSTHFKISIFRDIISLQSQWVSGHYISGQDIEDSKYSGFSERARSMHLRLDAKELPRDSRGNPLMFWEKESQLSQFTITRSGNFDVLTNVHGGGVIKVEQDGYLRYYDPSQSALTPYKGLSMGTEVKLIPLKPFYIQLGQLRASDSELSRIDSYKGLVNQVETNEDIRLLIYEVNNFIQDQRTSEKVWRKFQNNLDLRKSIIDLLKTFRTAFKTELDNSSELREAIEDTEEKFVTPPSAQSEDLPIDGTVVALAWADEKGDYKYVSIRPEVVISSEDEDSAALRSNSYIADFVGENITTLVIDDEKTPVHGDTHFRVSTRPGDDVMTLQSVSNGKNIQAFYSVELRNIESDYAEDDFYRRDTFDRYKDKLLGVTVDGEQFENVDSHQRDLEEFVMVGSRDAASLKSEVSKGYLSVISTTGRIGTIDPVTMRRAGMMKNGRLEPTPREQFKLVEISDYVFNLGEIKTETRLEVRLARYLYYVSGGSSAVDRRIFYDEIKHEVTQIVSDPEKWVNFDRSDQARKLLYSILNQMRQDDQYQKELSTEVESLLSMLNTGLVTGSNTDMPQKGDLIVLRSLMINELGERTAGYVTRAEHVFDPSKMVLRVDGNDILDPAAHFIADIRSGRMGIKLSAESDFHLRSMPIDSDKMSDLMETKRYVITQLAFDGKGFNSSEPDHELFVMEGDRNVAYLKNVGSGGYVSAGITDPSPTAEIPEKHDVFLRTVDPVTLGPRGKHDVYQSTQFELIVFGELYHEILKARKLGDYLREVESYQRMLPMARTNFDLEVLIRSLEKMVVEAVEDKQSEKWKEFSGSDVQSRFVSLLDLIKSTFTELDTTLVDRIDKLRKFEMSEAVPTFADRYQVLQKRADELTEELVEGFIRDLKALVQDRVSGVAINGDRDDETSVLDRALLDQTAAWLEQRLFYNNFIIKAEEKGTVQQLAALLKKTLTYDDLLAYLESWLAKPRFTSNEKRYVYDILQDLVSHPWLRLASASDFDLEVVRDSFLRARANQFYDRDEKDDADGYDRKITDLIELIAYPKIRGDEFILMVDDLYRNLPQSLTSKEGRDALSNLITKFNTWKDRVLLTGPDALSLAEYREFLLNITENVAASITVKRRIKPVLEEVTKALMNKNAGKPVLEGISDEDAETETSAAPEASGTTLEGVDALAQLAGGSFVGGSQTSNTSASQSNVNTSQSSSNIQPSQTDAPASLDSASMSNFLQGLIQ